MQPSTSTTKQPLIQLKNIRVTYNEGKSNEMTALHEINLEIYEGEYIVFLGPSGCGKSTLLYTIAGLEIPSAGTVVVDNKDLGTITPIEKIEFYRTTIGMIFQAFYLVAHLSAADNIMLAGMFAGRSVGDRHKKADMLMDRFGISTYSDRKPSNMSGGQQQRTAIARALMNDPHIILADEPVGNLDSKNALTVLELLADIHREEGKTIIQVTHNANDARYADRVFYMKDGNIEKVVTNANPDRGHSAEKDEATKAAEPKPLGNELEKLKADNPALSDTQLRALLIMRTVFQPYTLDTEHLMVKAIERYVKGEINVDELANELDTKHHGAGLYAPKAIHSSREIERLWGEMEVIREAAPAAGGSAEVAAVSATDFILQKYHGQPLTPEQKTVLTKHIEDRLACRTDRLAFIEAATAAADKGGSGLQPRTANRFADEIEVLLTR
jgi:putative ABC transport system ATP-binding protein